MFSLTEPLEDSIIIRGQKVAVDFSFDTVLLWYQLLEDDSILSNDKIEIAFDNFVEESFSPSLSLEEKVDVIDIISQHIKETPYGKTINVVSSTQEDCTSVSEKYFSYTQDAEAIYASFLFDYGIDLDLERGKLHYDKFKALLAGLSEKSYFKRILSIRQASHAKYEGEALTNLLEAQEYYALDSEKSVDNLDNQMGDIFSMLKAQAEG